MVKYNNKEVCPKGKQMKLSIMSKPNVAVG